MSDDSSSAWDAVVGLIMCTVFTFGFMRMVVLWSGVGESYSKESEPDELDRETSSFLTI